MNFSELNFDRLLPPPLLSIFSPREKTTKKILPVIVEVHPEIDKKVSKISELSLKIYSTIKQYGDRPFGDMWAEVNFYNSGTLCWIQADNAGSLIINTTSDEERHSLRIQTNDLNQPILYSEIRDKKTSEIKNEESILSPENYSYDGLYEACRLLRNCDSFLLKSFRTNLIDAIK